MKLEQYMAKSRHSITRAISYEICVPFYFICHCDSTVYGCSYFFSLPSFSLNFHAYFHCFFYIFWSFFVLWLMDFTDIYKNVLRTSHNKKLNSVFVHVIIDALCRCPIWNGFYQIFYSNVIFGNFVVRFAAGTDALRYFFVSFCFALSQTTSFTTFN